MDGCRSGIDSGGIRYRGDTLGLHCWMFLFSFGVAYMDKEMNQTGSKNSNWKGGICKFGDYIYIYKPEHPRATCNKGRYVKRADLVAEKKYNRALQSDEIVHHINGIKNDDRSENLQVITKREHVALHHTGYNSSVRRKDLSSNVICELYREGFSMREIADKFKCSFGSVRDRIPITERRTNKNTEKEKNSRWVSIDIDEMKRLRTCGLSYQRIAVIFGVSYGTIRNRLKGKSNDEN